jgi:hypothetical protein
MAGGGEKEKKPQANTITSDDTTRQGSRRKGKEGRRGEIYAKEMAKINNKEQQPLQGKRK